MIVILAFLIIIFILIQNASQNQGNEVSILGYKTKFFHISEGASKKMFENMKIDRLSPEMLKQFIVMEDAFLKLVQVAVCNSISLRKEGFIISDKIKDIYTEYDFSYHVQHIKQMSEPHKVINQNITC
tara:strand:+ start:124 stop:507 length:384 start_codon:yes stop_codon:yes gene_type:complete